MGCIMVDDSGVAAGTELPREATDIEDALLDCLVAVCALQRRRISAESLRAGLPLVDHRLTPELFARAARRAGLSARLTRRSLQRIPDELLPAVLLLKEGRACVLVGRDRKARTSAVIWPETGLGESTIDDKELKGLYRGFAYLIKATYVPDGDEQRGREPQAGHWFWGVIRRSWRVYRDVFAASLLINLFALAAPLYILNVYDRVVPNRAEDTLWILTAALAGVYLFDLAMRALRAYFIDLAGRRSDLALSATICERMLGLRMEARPASVGAFSSQVGEFDRVRDFLTATTMTMVIDLPFVVLFLMLIHWVAGDLYLVPLAAMLLVLLFSVLIQSPLHRAVGEVMRVAARKQSTLVESLLGLETIKSLRAESRQQRRWEQLTDEMGRWSMRSRMLSSSATIFASYVQHMAWLVMAVGGVYLVMDGKMTQGGLVAVIILTSRALAPLTQMAGLAARYNQARTALRNLNDLVALPQERPEGGDFVQPGHIEGALEFRDCTFNYPGQERPALDGVSLRIGAGERVGVIGRIGSGKTTLSKLLLGLYQAGPGQVRIDGLDVRQVDPAVLRRNVAMASQDVFLLNGTLRENIALGAPFADDSSILRAAETAGVTAFASSHPRGLDMPVGERGELLSGGQRQAVSLARTLLSDAPVLLLDEPTSHMDNATEVRLKQALSPTITGRTLIVITHRASLLELVDRLVVLEGGRLVADGPRDEILEALRQGKIRGFRMVGG